MEVRTQSLVTAMLPQLKLLLLLNTINIIVKVKKTFLKGKLMRKFGDLQIQTLRPLIGLEAKKLLLIMESKTQ